jgi:hypothetical protein
MRLGTWNTSYLYRINAWDSSVTEVTEYSRGTGGGVA